MITNGILLHTYHLDSKNWEHFVWGQPEEDKLGILPQFAYALLSIPFDENIRSVIFSGPSTKDNLTEGAYTKRFLVDRINKLSDFPSLKAVIEKLSPNDHDIFVRRLKDLSLGPVIKDTADEVAHAAVLFNEDQAADQVFQIANASHAPRCLQNQIIARTNKQIPHHQPWYVIASDVCFSDTVPDDVVILEPPHRGDDPMTNYSPTLASSIKPYFVLNAEKKKQFIQTVQKALLQ